MDTFNFPILWLNQSENSLGVFLDLDDLTSCAPGSQNFFKNLLLIGSDGVIKRVESAAKIGRTGTTPSGVPKFFAWLGMGLIRVKLNLDPNNQSIQFQDLIKTIVKMLKKNVEIWDADGELDELVKKIEASTSFSELVDIMNKRCWPDFDEKGGPWYKL